jgi:2',3'-cyclic-nucleotide 2'-phosphodiesterase (5'-nucleotidase family)
VDCGDAVTAGNVGVKPGGEPVLELMSDTGYLCMTMGNREFHIADALLRIKISDARFPVLCANMRWKEDRGETLPVVPHIITKTPNGDSVGIFGLTVPMVTPRMTARVLSAYLFHDPVEVAKKQIEELRSKVDYLIALTHIGIKEDRRLASECPELDAIIGGHTHVVLEEPELSSSVPIVQAGWHGHYIGRLTIHHGVPPSGELFPLKAK